MILSNPSRPASPSRLKRITMKSICIPFVLLALASAAVANIAPTVVIQSAAMRPGTTLMDVVYRVNDPDDAAVKTRALAFVDGVRSFAKVLRPATFVEGTAANLGDAIPSNTNHTLTWDVGTDWDIDLGQVKFEVLALDGRGLLPIDWISIPAAGGNPALTISKDTPSDAAVLNALFWQYADGDPALTLANGLLSGNAASGVFAGVLLANAATVQLYSAPYIFKKMNLDPASGSDVTYANTIARAGLSSLTSWHVVNRPYTGLSVIIKWGTNLYGQPNIPAGLSDITAISAGHVHILALKSNGTIVGWGASGSITSPPTGLTGVTAISAGEDHSLALKNDGTVVAFGSNSEGQSSVPPGLAGVIAVAAGGTHSLALKNDGTVVAWGWDSRGQITVPPGLAGVVAVAAGHSHSLALKSDGTVVAWGYNHSNQSSVPVGLAGVTAIAAGAYHSLALKNDGTVVAWGDNSFGKATIPPGVSGVVAISASEGHNLILMGDGTMRAWGTSDYGENLIPEGLIGVSSVSAGREFNVVLRTKAL
jgi:hypothetical protein